MKQRVCKPNTRLGRACSPTLKPFPQSKPKKQTRTTPQKYELVLQFERGEAIYDPSETQVIDAINSLTLIEGNSYCCLERKSGDYVQAMCGVNGFHVEWRVWQDVAADQYEHYKAGFHEPPGTKEPCTKAKHSVPGYSNELLRRADARALFLEFYESKPKPAQYAWRLMTFDAGREADLP